MQAIKLYLGRDVHKDFITIAIAPSGRASPIHLCGAITCDLHALKRGSART